MLTSEARSHIVTDLHSVRTDRWKFRHTAATDVGQRRSGNEDYFLLHPDRHLYVIADGMGGHAAGEVASQMASETLAAYFDEIEIPDSNTDHDSVRDHLVHALKIANAAIFEEAADRAGREGMGTTLVALTFVEDKAYWAHVGDSRLYRMRDGVLRPMTRDHSLLEQTLKRHDLSEEEARELVENFPYKNVLSRAVGSRYVVDVEVDSAPLQDGDLFLMTTDGVHDVIDDTTLQSVLNAHHGQWNNACQAIIDAANDAGGPDNITVACVEVHQL